MPTDVEICSTSLQLLGDKSISAFTDDSDSARLCKRLYLQTLDAVLRSHIWNFAVNRATIAQDAQNPDFGFDFSYTLPTDPFCVRVVTFNGDLLQRFSPRFGSTLEVAETPKFKVEGRKIMSDDSTAEVVFIGRELDTNKYDPLFVSALEARLAAEIAVPITGQTKLSEFYWKVYKEKMKEARTIDGQEGSSDMLISDDLINVRL